MSSSSCRYPFGGLLRSIRRTALSAIWPVIERMGLVMSCKRLHVSGELCDSCDFGYIDVDQIHGSTGPNFAGLYPALRLMTTVALGKVLSDTEYAYFVEEFNNRLTDSVEEIFESLIENVEEWLDNE